MANVDKRYILELTEGEIHMLAAVLGKVAAGVGPANDVYNSITNALWGVEDYLYVANIREGEGKNAHLEVWEKP